MPKFELVKEGDLLWDYHSEQAGNTVMRRWGNWPVKILSIDYEKRRAVVSWNHPWNVHHPKTYYDRDIQRLRRTKGPEK